MVLNWVSCCSFRRSLLHAFATSLFLWPKLARNISWAILYPPTQVFCMTPREWKSSHALVSGSGELQREGTSADVSCSVRVYASQSSTKQIKNMSRWTNPFTLNCSNWVSSFITSWISVLTRSMSLVMGISLMGFFMRHRVSSEVPKQLAR